MSAAATWVSHIVAVRMVDQAKSLETKDGWRFAAKAHLDAHFEAVEIEAAEGGFDDLGVWDALGSFKAWCLINPLDHRPLHRSLHQTRWKVKRKASH
jgi:hypothetical protein